MVTKKVPKIITKAVWQYDKSIKQMSEIASIPKEELLCTDNNRREKIFMCHISFFKHSQAALT